MDETAAPVPDPERGTSKTAPTDPGRPQRQAQRISGFLKEQGLGRLIREIGEVGP